jgi:hypothetical protein
MRGRTSAAQVRGWLGASAGAGAAAAGAGRLAARLGWCRGAARCGPRRAGGVALAQAERLRCAGACGPSRGGGRSRQVLSPGAGGMEQERARRKR